MQENFKLKELNDLLETSKTMSLQTFADILTMFYT